MACPVCLDGCLDLHTQPASIADDGERVQPPRIRCIVKPHNLVCRDAFSRHACSMLKGAAQMCPPLASMHA